jgi:hypothetical protein
MEGMNRPEQRLQIAVAQFLEIALPHDAVWFHVPNGGKRTPVEGGIFKAMGVKAGVPDLWIFYRNKTFAIELKAKRGRHSNEQIFMQVRLERAGVLFAESRSLEDVIARLSAWHIPLRAELAA